MQCHRSIAVGAMLAAALVAAPGVAQNATIVVESRTLPAFENFINVRLEVGTDVEIAGTANTLIFAARAPIPARPDGRPDCQVNVEINKGAASFTFVPPGCLAEECTGVRALVRSIDNVDPIPSGSTLYSCAVDPATPFGSYLYDCADPGAQAPDASEVAAVCRGGEIVVEARAALLLGADNYDSLYPPRTCRAHLVSRAPLRRLNAQIAFPPEASLGLTQAGRPGCRLDPPLDGVMASFSCAASDCASVAVELTTEEAAGMDDVTFRCDVVPDVSAPEGFYPITVAAATARDIDGGPVPVDSSDSGTAVFPPAPTPAPVENALVVGSVVAAPESTVQLPIVLRSDLPLTHVVFGVRRIRDLDTGFAFRSDGDGHPVCSATAPLRIVDSSFTPEPCTGEAECESIRLEVAGANPGDALPEGTTTLATCDLVVDRQSEIGLPIVCQFVEAHSGSQNLSLACEDGHLEVAFPTATPTATAPPATPTNTRNPHAGGSSGGCQLGDRTAAAWPLVLALALWWRRRRALGVP